jgi:hypothetical protein
LATFELKNEDMSAIKYVLFLVVLFVLGLAMLGLFNPHLEFEVEEEVVSTISSTWDTYRDTSKWAQWKTKGGEMTWNEGTSLVKGANYTIKRRDGHIISETIDEMITDSVVVFLSEYENGIEKTTTVSFMFENGHTKITEHQVWETTHFVENIKINFNRSNEEKIAEKNLESFKKMIEQPFLDREKEMMN